MDNKNTISNDALEILRLEGLQKRAAQLQLALDSLRPQDTVLRRIYEENLEIINEQIKELKGKGL